MIRILVADDHPVVRHGIKQMVTDTPDMRVVAEAATGKEVLDAIEGLACDVILLDLSLPDYNGLDVLKEIKLLKPGIAVLILSMYAENQFAVRALRAGASGYLTKESAPSELVGAVRKVVQGGRYVSPSLAETLANDLTQGTYHAPHEKLSDREYQVLRMLASGKTTGEIAQELSLSVKTVSTYRSRVLDKLGMSTRAELTSYALRHHLAD